MQKQYEDLLDQYPFLTVLSYAGNEYVGVMQNIDTQVLM